jgi:hypothetical protein
MTDQNGQEQPEEIVLDGPDPRDWANQQIGRACANVQAILDVQALRKAGGSVFGNAHDAAARLLDQLLDTAQGELTILLLTSYGLDVPERSGEPDFPYSNAGKPRAYGTAQPREDIVPSPPAEPGKPA